MKKLFNADILDIFPTENGFVYACKDIIESEKEVVSFFEYNKKIDLFERISVKTYISCKFGEDGFETAKALGDFITCKIIRTESGNTLGCYNDGTIRIINNLGKKTDEFMVRYKEFPVCSPVYMKESLWFAVPECNSIIKYSLKNRRLEMRVGSNEDKILSHPVNLSLYDNDIFICNSNSFTIKIFDPDNFQIKNYRVFNEPVFGYFLNNSIEYVILKSGVYSI